MEEKFYRNFSYEKFSFLHLLTLSFLLFLYPPVFLSKSGSTKITRMKVSHKEERELTNKEAEGYVFLPIITANSYGVLLSFKLTSNLQRLCFRSTNLVGLVLNLQGAVELAISLCF